MGLFKGLFKGKKQKEEWNDRLWDMHCHIVPGVDDGSKNLEMSMEMLQMEIEEGVTDIMLTPHFNVGRTKRSDIEKAYNILLNEVQEQGLPINLYLGAEIFYSVELVSELQKGNALTLNGTRYVLIEFMPSDSYHKIENAVRSLTYAGYIPVLAHVERYEDLTEEIECVEDLVSMGAYIQVNSNSFLKKDSRKFAMELLDEQLVHLIGTDAHSTSWRKPQMKDTVSTIVTHSSLQQAKSILLFGDKLVK